MMNNQTIWNIVDNNTFAYQSNISRVSDNKMNISGGTFTNSINVTGNAEPTNLYIPMPRPNIVSVTAGTGGSMAAGTYYYVITAIDPDGLESLQSPEKSVTVVANGKATIDFTYVGYQPSGSVSIKIYRSTVSGTYTTPSYIATATSANTYVDTSASPSAGQPPTINQAYTTQLKGINGATSRIGGPLIVTSNGNWYNPSMTVRGYGGTGNGILSLMRPNTGRWATMNWITGTGTPEAATIDWSGGTYYFQGINVYDFAFYGGAYGSAVGVSNAPAGQNIGFTIASNANRYVGIGRNTQFPNQQLQLNNGDIAVNLQIPTNVSSQIFLSGGSLADGTYYYFVSALDSLGGETNVLNNSRVVVSGGGGNAKVNLNWSASYGAVSYKIYRSTVAGIATGYSNSYLNITNITFFNDTGVTASAGGVWSTTAYVNRISANGNSYLTGGNLGIGTKTPTEPLTVIGNSTANITLRVEGNVIAHGYLTSTELYNTASGSAIKNTHETAYYLNKGSIDDIKMDKGRCYTAIDYSKPKITEIKETEKINITDISGHIKEGDIQKVRTEVTYPYNATFCDMSLSAMIMKHEQAIAEIAQEMCLKEPLKWSWCK